MPQTGLHPQAFMCDSGASQTETQTQVNPRTWTPASPCAKTYHNRMQSCYFDSLLFCVVNQVLSFGPLTCCLRQCVNTHVTGKGLIVYKRAFLASYQVSCFLSLHPLMLGVL
eukprot:4593499-Amphidinium_carterae.1